MKRNIDQMNAYALQRIALALELIATRDRDQEDGRKCEQCCSQVTPRSMSTCAICGAKV